jgi:hypothetical protein
MTPRLRGALHQPAQDFAACQAGNVGTFAEPSALSLQRSPPPQRSESARRIAAHKFGFLQFHGRVALLPRHIDGTLRPDCSPMLSRRPSNL